MQNHYHCNPEEMSVLGQIEADEKFRIEVDGRVDLISANPAKLAKAPGIRPELTVYLEEASNRGLRVNLFSTGSNICLNN